MITAVIFDMDGVIADSEYFNVKAKHLILKRQVLKLTGIIMINSLGRRMNLCGRR